MHRAVPRVGGAVGEDQIAASNIKIFECSRGPNGHSPQLSSTGTRQLDPKSASPCGNANDLSPSCKSVVASSQEDSRKMSMRPSPPVQALVALRLSYFRVPCIAGFCAFNGQRWRGAWLCKAPRVVVAAGTFLALCCETGGDVCGDRCVAPTEPCGRVYRRHVGLPI